MSLMRPASLSVLLLLAGCTWVTPTPEARDRDIAVLDTGAAARCQLLTDAELTVADKLGNLERMPADVAKDLQTLAMNQAAAAGGDAIVPRDQPQGGKQHFGLYRCQKTAAAPAPGTTPAPPAITQVKTFPYNPPR